MKKLIVLLSFLVIALAGTCQTSSIISIPPGTEITLPTADHWRYMMPQNTMVSVGQNLARAKGCIVDYNVLQATVSELEAQVQLLETALSYVDTAKAALVQVEQVQEALKLREKIRQWFQNRWKDLTAFMLGTVAAFEAGYIIYKALQ